MSALDGPAGLTTLLPTWHTELLRLRQISTSEIRC